MKFSLPENIYYIISIINNNGYSAHLVGGCVRDMLIGKIPEDWDITTDASPDAIKAMFVKTYDTGIKHGTVTVSYGGTPAEVTTWRTESRYSDHRHPDRVDFADSLTEDLSRRDFTINSLAYHPDEGLIDPFDGCNDIKLKVIRCVGDPTKRFSEDALRMLRAIRFSSMLGFNIEKETLAAIQTLWHDLAYVSMERIQSEVNKILESDNPENLVLLWETGLNKIVFPGIPTLPDKWTCHTKKLKKLKKKKVVLLSLLFIYYFENDASDQAGIFLRRLRYDNATISGVLRQIDSIMDFGAASCRNIRKMISKYDEETCKNTLLVFELNNSFYDSPILMKLPSVKPALSGYSLKEAGICHKEEIGIMLEILSMCLYEKPALNDGDTLMLLSRAISCLPVWKKAEKRLS